MKLIGKLVVAVESALVSSAYWLWNLCTKDPNTIIVGTGTLIDGVWVYSPEPNFYPYQTLGLALLVAAGIVGVGYLVYKWKTRPKPMPQNHLEGWTKQ